MGWRESNASSCSGWLWPDQTSPVANTAVMLCSSVMSLVCMPLSMYVDYAADMEKHGPAMCRPLISCSMPRLILCTETGRSSFRCMCTAVVICSCHGQSAAWSVVVCRCVLVSAVLVKGCSQALVLKHLYFEVMSQCMCLLSLRFCEKTTCSHSECG